ncbi:heavy-metal-associated domain-containing protein [Plantibacter flavus]|uniref:heavy-metal-associated domain-containing protein n=1 Tax=Plantibacter flavus TaxID=150123 RepID=UPI003F1664A8
MSSITTSTTYRVDGMTCGHCVSSVTSELTALGGVDTVAVDLGAGTIVVTGTGADDEAAIAGGVDEAGYTLIGRV